MKRLFFTVVLLNFLDLAGTLFLISKGGVEANPIMAALIGQSPWLFVFVKAVVVPAAAWCLYKTSSKKLLLLCAAAYASVCCLHAFLLVTHAF